ncbi:MAG: DUF11 domain-containing protein, partial [Actinomycetia bacterium]|nr:DUF11 domain-containing protein [Actinomycetes bacterium]
DGTITLSEGQDATCYVNNDDIAPKLTVIKTVINDNGGTKTVADFELHVYSFDLGNSSSVISGVQRTFFAGEYDVHEHFHSGYTHTIGGDCAADGSITLNLGDDKTCTLTNDDIAPTPDLAVAKTESVDPVIAGSGTGNLTHTVTVTNEGPAAATSVVMDESIDIPGLGVTIDSITPSTGSLSGLSIGSSDTSGTWTIGALASGASETLTVVYTVAGNADWGIDVIGNTASVNSVT